MLLSLLVALRSFGIDIAGAAGAATDSIQMMTGAVVSGLFGTLYEEHSALSMPVLTAECSLVVAIMRTGIDPNGQELGRQMPWRPVDKMTGL